MKRNNRFTKRFLALFLVLCFVLGQINLPAGLIKISPDFSFLHTKAASQFTVNLTAYSTVGDVSFNFPATFEITNTGKVAMVGTNATGTTGGNAYLEIPSTVKDGDTSYTIESIGKEGSKLDVFQGQVGLDSVTIPNSVTAIYDQAFSGCSALVEAKFSKDSKLEYIGESAFQGCFIKTGNVDNKYKDNAFKLSLPSTMKTIKRNAFQGCSQLNTVTIAEGAQVTLEKEAFSGLTKLVTVSLPDTTVAIGENCFYECRELTTIGDTLPSSLTEIPAGAFYNCAKLKCKYDAKDSGIKFSSNINSIGKECFFGCKEIGIIDLSKTKVETIPEAAFQNSGVTKIIFNDAINTIEKNAFNACTSLCRLTDGYVTDLDFPSSLNVIGDNAFQGCTSIGLINWTVGNSSCELTSLGEYAFAGCTSLQNLVIPKSLTKIPAHAFEGCSGMGRLSVPTTVTTIGDNAFANCLKLSVYFNYVNVADTNTGDDDDKTSSFLPSDLASIGEAAFSQTNLINFEIPEKVTQINASTFYKCQQLKTVKLHNNIKLIGNNAFSECILLEESTANNPTFTIPASVETIGKSVFAGCSALQKVKFATGSKITTLKDKTSLFERCTKLTEVTLPDAVTDLPASTFFNDSALTTVYMDGADNLTEIGNDCFGGCAKFTGFNGSKSGELTLPSTLSNLGDRAFEGCKEITVADLGNTSITSINSKTFKDTSLDTVIFPRSLTGAINADAFAGCKLTSIKFQYPEKIASINEQAFKKGTKGNIEVSYIDSNCKFTVPSGLVDAYYNRFTELGFTFLKDAFTGVDIASTSITLTITGAANLTVGKAVTVNVKQDGSSPYHLESSKPDVVKVVDSETILPLKIGEATITAVINNSTMRSNDVTAKVIPSGGAAAYVKDPITTITPDTTSLGTSSTDYKEGDSRLFVGQSKDISIQTGIGTGAVGEAEADILTWTLNSIDGKDVDSGTNYVDNGFIRIDYQQPSNGKANATITAKAYTKTVIKATCASSCISKDININISPTYDEITPKKAEVSTKFVDNMIDAKTYFTFKPASPDKLTWSSSNSAIATIDEQGKIKCVSPGQTTISVSSEISNKTSSVTLTITNDITKVTTADNKTSYTVVAGQPLTFTANVAYDNESISSPDTLTWTSSNEEVAKVSAVASGASYTVSVSTLKAGSASIVGTSSTGRQFKFSVSATAVQFEKTSFSLFTAGPNKKGTIKVKSELPKDASISYKMANSKAGKIASVSASGVITGKKKGSAQIKVTVYGVSYNINVNVTEATLTYSVPGAAVNKKRTQYTISKQRKKTTLAYNANYLGTTKKKASFKSSKKSVATISKKGEIKLKKKGTTTITITVNGVKKTFKLKVIK